MLKYSTSDWRSYLLFLRTNKSFRKFWLAGVLVDRFSRKNIMIVCDILRIAVVLASLFVTKPEQVWLIYVLAIMQEIAFSFFVSAAAYISFSQMPMIFLAALFVFFGHIGGAVQWVFSTTLLQSVVADEYRGRVFAAEMAVVTLVLSISTYCTGAALDAGINPRHVALVLGCLFLVPGVSWLLYLHRMKRLSADSW